MGDRYNGRVEDMESMEELPRVVIKSVANPVRRSILRYLEAVETTTVDRLALIATGLSTHGERQLATTADHRRTRIELHHVHLPQLEQAGLIEYDAESRETAIDTVPDGLFGLVNDTDALEDRPQQSGEARPAGPEFEGDPVAAVPVSSLRGLIATVEHTQVTVQIFSPKPREEVVSQFINRNVQIDHESLPSSLSPGFAVVDRDGVLRFCHLDVLTSVDEPPTGEPWDDDTDRTAYRQFLGLFRNTPFSTTDRAQLLATSREIEDRAWRTGKGELHAGFQSISVFRSQAESYRRLAEETELDVRVYGRPDRTPLDSTDLRTVAVDDDDIGRVWFVVYRDPSGENSCALLAEERSPDEYFGFWTYDDQRVGRIVEYLDATYTVATE